MITLVNSGGWVFPATIASVVAREPQHARIHVNLALDDVFSFDVKQNSTLRENFEALFHRYEDSVQEHTEAVLRKAAANDNDGMHFEVFEVFKAKLMNFMRNPFAVAKMLERQVVVGRKRGIGGDGCRCGE